NRGDGAKKSIEPGLGQEVPAEPSRAIVDRLGCTAKIVRADEPDQAVAEIPALEQEEDHEDYDEAKRGKRIQQGLEYALNDLHGRRRGLVNLDWNWGARKGTC